VSPHTENEALELIWRCHGWLARSGLIRNSICAPGATVPKGWNVTPKRL
jgi:hypothetical protein